MMRSKSMLGGPSWSTKKERKGFPWKVKAVFTLVVSTFVISAFLDDDAQRGLQGCKTVPDLITEMGDSEVRRLHRLPFDSETLHERLLELGAEDPCLSVPDGKRTLLKCNTIPELMAQMGENEVRRTYTAPSGLKTPYEQLLEVAMDKPCLDEIDVQRAMNTCKTIPELIAEMGTEDFRKLHNAPFDTKTIYERLLELAAEDPCLTEFPPQIQESIAAPEIIQEMTEEPLFDVAADDDDQFIALEGDDMIGITPESDMPLDTGERDLVEVFPPEEYDIGGAVDGPLEADAAYGAGTIAYTVPLTSCPEWYEPSVDSNAEPVTAPDLYEASAILKTQVCETSDTATSNRRLGITRKLVVLQDEASAAEMDYTMHALVHPMTIECPVEGADADDTYDRVKLMKSLDYEVDVVGHAITEKDLEEAGQDFILENIEGDVGVRDTTKLHIWRMTSHPVVVLMTYKTILQKPIDEEIDVLLADENLKGMYILNAPDPVTGAAGVDTSFLIIKPDLNEFDKIVKSYINTPYDPINGWNGEGYNKFEGHLGLPGFLAYYFATNPGYQQLDRCMYANDGDELCAEQFLMNDGLIECKAFKMVESVCGNPRDCPYDHYSWSASKKEACSSLHRKYYDYRYKFEEKYFNKKVKQERIGLFKTESFLGYCTGAGNKYHLSLVGNIIPKQDWQTTCPPDGCPEGSFMKSDCTCTEDGEDPCNACPDNTYCQKSPTLMCIDCTCGFCDNAGTACCDFNGVNNCKAGPGDNKYCNLQKNFFPAYPGSGNACGGVEISRTAMPNGCGCKPNSNTPCTYSQEWGNSHDKCFICTADDLANGECESCKRCMRSCTESSCVDDAITGDDFKTCFSEIVDKSCRASCHGFCMKSNYLTFPIQS